MSTYPLKLSITLDTFPTRIMKRSVRRQPLRRIFAALQQEEAHQWTSSLLCYYFYFITVCWLFTDFFSEALFEDKFAAWRLMRVPPSNSQVLSALGISSEDEEKQQHFCHCSSPFYSAACVWSLLSVALFDCIFSIGINLGKIAFTQFIFQTHSRQSETFSYIYWCRLWVKFNPIH